MRDFSKCSHPRYSKFFDALCSFPLQLVYILQAHMSLAYILEVHNIILSKLHHSIDLDSSTALYVALIPVLTDKAPFFGLGCRIKYNAANQLYILGEIFRHPTSNKAYTLSSCTNSYHLALHRWKNRCPDTKRSSHSIQMGQTSPVSLQQFDSGAPHP